MPGVKSVELIGPCLIWIDLEIWTQLSRTATARVDALLRALAPVGVLWRFRVLGIEVKPRDAAGAAGAWQKLKRHAQSLRAQAWGKRL